MSCQGSGDVLPGGWQYPTVKIELRVWTIQGLAQTRVEEAGLAMEASVVISDIGCAIHVGNTGLLKCL